MALLLLLPTKFLAKPAALCLTQVWIGQQVDIGFVDIGGITVVRGHIFIA